jgi:hypothetical protein
MRKGGISAVVATVLIILIVVVAVGVLWGVVLPLFRDLDYLDYSDVGLNIVLQGYTVYYPAEHFAFVQIERRQDEVDVTGLEIGFIFGGTTKTYQTLAVPSPGGKHSYKFNFSADGIPVGMIPDKVNVAPIFTLDNKVKLGKILDEVDMPIGEVHLSEEGWEEARLEAENNTLKGALYTYYLDGDGDGYGGAIFEEVEKGMNTTGYISRGGDCNDVIGSGEAINPGAVEDYSNDGDEDCDDRVEVNDCRTLGAEGVTYYLDGDVSAGGDCFLLYADNIVLDLNGYSIIGSGSNKCIYDTYEYNSNGVTIKNGEIRDCGAGVSVDYNPIDDLIVENVLFDENVLGVFLYGAASTSILNSEFYDNTEAAIGVNGMSEDFLVRDVTANNNGDGAWFWGSGGVLTIDNLETNNNNNRGLELKELVVVNNMVDVTSCGNGISDIYCFTSNPPSVNSYSNLVCSPTTFTCGLNTLSCGAC